MICFISTYTNIRLQFMKDAGLFQQEEFDTRYKNKIRRAVGGGDRVHILS